MRIPSSATCFLCKAAQLCAGRAQTFDNCRDNPVANCVFGGVPFHGRAVFPTLCSQESALLVSCLSLEFSQSFCGREVCLGTIDEGHSCASSQSLQEGLFLIVFGCRIRSRLPDFLLDVFLLDMEESGETTLQVREDGMNECKTAK